MAAKQRLLPEQERSRRETDLDVNYGQQHRILPRQLLCRARHTRILTVLAAPVKSLTWMIHKRGGITILLAFESTQIEMASKRLTITITPVAELDRLV